MLKKPLFTRKNQDCTAKNQIGNIVFNYRFTGNSRLKEHYMPYYKSGKKKKEPTKYGMREYEYKELKSRKLMSIRMEPMS